MYPSAELSELGRRKRVLCSRIATSRLDCASLASHVARPLNLLDRAIEQWRRIPPVAKMAALPVGWFLRRTVFARKRGHFLGQAIRLLPMVLGTLKLWKAPRRSRKSE